MSTLLDEFEELMRLDVTESPIEDTRDLLVEFHRELLELPEQEEQLNIFASIRNVSPEAFTSVGAVMYPEGFPIDPKYCTPDLELDRMEGRFLYPIYNARASMIGLVGYDPTTNVKYMDSKVYGYKANDSVFFGMQDIENYYRSNEPVIIVEGPVCCTVLKHQGFQAMSALGSWLSPYFLTVLRRFGRRCIVIPDADEAGVKLARQVAYGLKEARVIMTTSSKDVDDSRQINPEFFANLEKMIHSPFLKLPL